jgi:hypothetical protein
VRIPGASEHVQFVVLQSIADFLRYSSKIAQTNFACIVIVEQLKCAADLFHRIPRQYPLAHYTPTALGPATHPRRTEWERTYFREVFKVHQPMVRLIMVSEYLQDLGLLEIKAESSHGDLEFVIIHTPILVGIKQLKSLLDLLFLLVCKLRSRVCASFGFLRG